MSPTLVREDHPPHIYVRGDGQLRGHNRSTSNLIYCFHVPFLFVYCLSRRALETLGRGSSLLLCTVKQSFSSPKLRNPFVALLEKHPSLATKVRGLSCVGTVRFSTPTQIGDSAGDEALTGLHPVLATKKSSSRVCNLER